MSASHLTAKSVPALVKETFNDWLEDNALRLSAALAYYSIFSIAPLIVISIAIAGWVLGPEAAQGLLDDQLRGLLGSQVAEGVQGMVKSASKPTSSLFAGIMGALTLLLGASGVFGQLKDALNTIWKVKAKPGQGVMKFIRERLLSFGMVLVIGFLLLVSLLMTTALAGVTKYGGSVLPFSEALMGVIGFILSFGVVTVLFAAIFKLLPDVTVPWRNVWIGAGVTALLFEIGKFLLGFYLGRESTASPYGAAASAVLVLLWVYYASLILFFGAEFTRVFAKNSGSKIVPKSNAEPVTVESRAEQGIPIQPNPSPVATTAVSYDEARPRKESLYLALGALPPEPPPATQLVAALGGGFAVGLILRRLVSTTQLSPAEQVKEGSRALLVAGATGAAAYLARLLSRAKVAFQPDELREKKEWATQKAREAVERTVERFT